MNPYITGRNYFSSDAQQFMYYDKYAKYREDLGRRETWPETVDRVVDYLMELSENKLEPSLYKLIHKYILEMKVMPSMRLVASAGAQARRNNISLYNCSFLGVDSPDAFAEALFISMSGCGVGFSVEKKYTNLLRDLPHTLEHINTTHIISDSAEGWYYAVKDHLYNLFNGKIMDFDYSLVRPKGAVLKTKGGRASGPEPLKKLIDFLTDTFLAHYNTPEYAGEGQYYSRTLRYQETPHRLSNLEVFDMMCHVGNCAVSGGSRRTAMLCLFDMDDEEMKHAKTGEYPWIRSLSNNSMVWPREGISHDDFSEWVDHLFKYDNGEYSVWNPKPLEFMAHMRDVLKVVGVNPCGEINLRNDQFCNLSSIIASFRDTLYDLAEKVKVAALIGTIQAMATNFPLLRPIWKKNCEEERLLGVDINGIMDCPLLINDNGDVLRYLREVAHDTNKFAAQRLGITPATSVTCVKPNGNSSELLNCSSGMKPREAPYYIRRYRVSVTSPVYKVLFESGVPLRPENGQTWYDMTTAVASFYVKSPPGAKTQAEFTAVGMCKFWLKLKQNWTDHNPSVTIRYYPEEKQELREWLWENRDWIGGMTFLPVDQTAYEQPPYEAITREEYEQGMNTFPLIDWELLEKWEKDDMTTSAQEIACGGTISCDIF